MFNLHLKKFYKLFLSQIFVIKIIFVDYVNMKIHIAYRYIIDTHITHIQSLNILI